MTMEAVQPFAVCLFGPTGTGKSALALELAGEFPVEIISVDSAMVYRQMDIGTAKPTLAERSAVPHHLIDIRDPWESYSAGCFARDARALIPDILARGNVPLLVGGTLLYFRSLLHGLASLPEADEALREEIERDAARLGWAALHAELARVDPQTAARLAPADRQRIQRALEVFRLTGEPLSVQLLKRSTAGPAVDFLRIALRPGDRQALYRELDARLEAMWRSGLVEEVRSLQRLPLMTAACPAMRAVGYRQVWRFLAGEIDQAEALRQAAVATRRLAKRQLTWLRKETADLQLEVPARDALRLISSLIESKRVSRQPLLCNIMGGPTPCREHGV